MEEKKSKLEILIASGQLIILAYSTATAAQGLYKMGNEGMDHIYKFYKSRTKTRHLKSVS